MKTVNMTTLEEIKECYHYGLDKDGLNALIRVSPETKVAMKVRSNNGDSRPVMTALEAKQFIANLEANNLKDGHICELWIVG